MMVVTSDLSPQFLLCLKFVPVYNSYATKLTKPSYNKLN